MHKLATRPGPPSPAATRSVPRPDWDTLVSAPPEPDSSNLDRVPLRVWLLLGILSITGLASILFASAGAGGLWLLFLYSIPSNTAIAVLPHEPALLLYGAFADIWIAAAVATAGTLVAAWLDHSAFVPLLNLQRLSGYKRTRLYRHSIIAFNRAPFAALVVAGLTPIPFFPFKLLAFSRKYPVGSYLVAVAVGRYPRYALLLWVGSAIDIPVWALVGVVLLVFAGYGVHFAGRARAGVVPAETAPELR